MIDPAKDRRKLAKQLGTFALALGIWFAPIPVGLTSQAWHLFAIFAARLSDPGRTLPSGSFLYGVLRFCVSCDRDALDHVGRRIKHTPGANNQFMAH